MISQLSQIDNTGQLIDKIAQLINDAIIDNNIRLLAVNLADSGLIGLDTDTKKIDLTPENAKKIFDYVFENVKYVPDIDNIETLQTAEVSLKNKFGDCDDFAILLGSLYRSIGFTYALVLTQGQGFNSYNHIYGCVYTTQGWYYVDSSNKETGYFGFDYDNADIIKKKVIVIGTPETADKDFFVNDITTLTYYSKQNKTDFIKPVLFLGILFSTIYFINK